MDMKRSHFTENRIIGILREHDALAIFGDLNIPGGRLGRRRQTFAGVNVCGLWLTIDQGWDQGIAKRCRVR